MRRGLLLGEMSRTDNENENETGSAWSLRAPQRYEKGRPPRSCLHFAPRLSTLLSSHSSLPPTDLRLDLTPKTRRHWVPGSGSSTNATSVNRTNAAACRSSSDTAVRWEIKCPKIVLNERSKIGTRGHGERERLREREPGKLGLGFAPVLYKTAL